MPFELTSKQLRSALNALSKNDVALRRAIARVGYPAERRRTQSFATLLRIIVGQQVSTKAAAAIVLRLETSLGGLSAEKLLARSTEELRTAGLSRRKAEYCQGLARAVQNRTLKLRALSYCTDQEVMQRLVALKGLGPWSAQMYLMFALGRSDIWPTGDLAVQTAVARFRRLKERPGRDELELIGEAWRPHRSAVALFAWHYLKSMPA